MPRTPEQNLAITQERLRTARQNANQQADLARTEGRRSGLSQGRVEGGVVGVAGTALLGAVLLFGSGALGKGGPDASPTPEPSLKPGATLTLPPTEAPTLTAAPTEAPSASPSAAPTEAPSASPSAAPTDSESLAPVTGEWVAVPATLKEIKVMGLEGGSTAEDGTVFPQFEEGKWFHPLYDRFQVDPSKDQWRGVGPWYPVEFKNLDENAALLSTHGNVGELIVVSDQGGWVEVGFWQLDNYQDDGSYGRGPDGVGDIYQDASWAMQYTFKELGANAEVLVIDPDTGNPYTWEDGSPVIYRANELGTASFEIPQTIGNDVRVAFRFMMPSASDAVQPHEVKIERGPNDRPRRTGENLLPDSVLKPEVPLE